jgi:hypothetical protein
MTVQTLKLSVFFHDETHPDIQLRLSVNEADCDVVIWLLLLLRLVSVAISEARSGNAVATEAHAYVLGGYAGIGSQFSNTCA